MVCLGVPLFLKSITCQAAWGDLRLAVTSRRSKSYTGGKSYVSNEKKKEQSEKLISGTKSESVSMDERTVIPQR